MENIQASSIDQQVARPYKRLAGVWYSRVWTNDLRFNRTEELNDLVLYFRSRSRYPDHQSMLRCHEAVGRDILMDGVRSCLVD